MVRTTVASALAADNTPLVDDDQQLRDAWPAALSALLHRLTPTVGRTKDTRDAALALHIEEQISIAFILTSFGYSPYTTATVLQGIHTT